MPTHGSSSKGFVDRLWQRSARAVDDASRDPFAWCMYDGSIIDPRNTCPHCVVVAARGSAYGGHADLASGAVFAPEKRALSTARRANVSSFGLCGRALRELC